jgi:NAD dependent epimerase/dehydratase family enzyme
VPGFLTAAAVRLLVGEMAGEMLLSGSFVYPRRAQDLGFQFQFERPESALEDLL